MVSAFASEAGLAPGLGALLRFLLFAILCIGAPGAGLQRAIAGTIVPALVAPVGLAFCAATYWASLRLESSWFFFLAVALGAAGLARRRRTARQPVPLPWGPLGGFGLALVGFLALSQYRANSLLPDGRAAFDPLVTADTAFHVGLAHELAIAYPPQTPGLSGTRLAYHLGADLVRAAALRHFGVPPLASLSRFDVTLGAAALGLALASLAAVLGLPRVAVAAAPWTLFLTDFSFVVGANPRAHWWADLFRGNVLLSLAYSNPVIPALTLASGGLVALALARRNPSRGLGLLAVGLATAVPFFKVFLGVQLAAALALAAFLGWRHKDRALWFWLAALGAAAGTVLVAGQAAATSVGVALAPFDLALTTARQLGFPAMEGIALAGFATVWLILSLGLRVLGVPRAAAALASPDPVAAASATLGLSGWLTGLLFRISAATLLPGAPVINDAAFFVEQSGVFLWLFALPRLIPSASVEPRVRLASLAAMAALALPSTAQFVLKKRGAPVDAVPAPMVRAVAALADASLPGDVVLARPAARYPPVVSLLAGRRLVFERFTPYRTQFADSRLLEVRHLLVHRFFRTREPAEARAIALVFGARFVCLFGEDRLRFDPAGFLDPVYREHAASVYAIRQPGGE